MRKRDSFGIYARIEFSPPQGEPQWNRIGDAIQLDDGTVDLRVRIWPSNAKSIRILPDDDKSEQQLVVGKSRVELNEKLQ